MLGIKLGCMFYFASTSKPFPHTFRGQFLHVLTVEFFRHDTVLSTDLQGGPKPQPTYPVASPGFSHRRGTTNMFTKAGIHHRNVYIKKYDKLAHLITHKMAWSFQRQASVISIKTVDDTSSVLQYPFQHYKTKVSRVFRVRSSFAVYSQLVLVC